MATAGKDKKAKEGRDEMAALLRRLSEEVAMLRGEVETIKESVPPHKTTGKDLIHFEENEPLTSEQRQRFTPEQDAQAARVGYAFSSVPKTAIIRILLTEGPLSSAQIGEKANLTTGSLYHHLRELAHAGVIEPAGRNLHRVTATGKKAALTLFALPPETQGR